MAAIAFPAGILGGCQADPTQLVRLESLVGVVVVDEPRVPPLGFPQPPRDAVQFGRHPAGGQFVGVQLKRRFGQRAGLIMVAPLPGKQGESGRQVRLFRLPLPRRAEPVFCLLQAAGGSIAVRQPQRGHQGLLGAPCLARLDRFFVAPGQHQPPGIPRVRIFGSPDARRREKPDAQRQHNHHAPAGVTRWCRGNGEG